MFRQQNRIERVGTISDFMQRNQDIQKPKVNEKSKYIAVATGTLVPLIFAQKAFAAESINQCGQVLAVSSSATAVPVNAVTDKVMGDVISAFAHLFDPLIDLMIAISFPVASAIIVWKIFCGFFKDQGEIWEGIGKVSIVYLLVQMSPIFIKILKSLGTLAVGI
jgi:hypothetical protein